MTLVSVHSRFAGYGSMSSKPYLYRTCMSTTRSVAWRFPSKRWRSRTSAIRRRLSTDRCRRSRFRRLPNGRKTDFSTAFEMDNKQIRLLTTCFFFFYLFITGVFGHRQAGDGTHDYMSDPSVSRTFSKTRNAVVRVEHTDVIASRVHYRMVVRRAYVEHFRTAIVTEWMTELHGRGEHVSRNGTTIIKCDKANGVFRGGGGGYRRLGPNTFFIW